MENNTQTNECTDQDIDNKYINSLEKFVIEYPLNYEEIVSRKLRILELEYEETIKCEIKIKCEKEEKDEILENVEENHEHTEEADYQRISSSGGCVYECMDDDEGFVEVEEEEEVLKENENENEIGSEIKRDDLIEGLEFVNNQEETMSKDTDSKLNLSRDFIPVKDPEKIKNAMKSFTMKPPKWAENLNDDDFLNIVKNALMNKNFIKNNPN